MSGAIRQAKAFDLTEQTRVIETKKENKIHVHITNVPRVLQSNWAQKISDGKFVVSIELLPPKGLEIEAILARSKCVRNIHRCH